MCLNGADEKERDEREGENGQQHDGQVPVKTGVARSVRGVGRAVARRARRRGARHAARVPTLRPPAHPARALPSAAPRCRGVRRSRNKGAAASGWGARARADKRAGGAARVGVHPASRSRPRSGRTPHPNRPLARAQAAGRGRMCIEWHSLFLCGAKGPKKKTVVADGLELGGKAGGNCHFVCKGYWLTMKARGRRPTSSPVPIEVVLPLGLPLSPDDA